ncbi:Ycf66 family protein [Pleurocapsa sp. FMAR1]|uniref:Ycf66 family protein n=1 Tax=Pleurocapsa sp. FMAR1 TaxID=3040204 RepID=UPI0029C65222|nr:Ycf66 family protein [Pleurocapsa sp. FMAR1]
MVNFGLNAAAILGIFLAVAGAGLFFLRSIRPELARDYDIFFAAVGLLCGVILLFNGWRLDPILQFGQFLLTGTAIFFAFESIRMRGVATEQARRNTPVVDRDRPVSSTRVYTEAELDKIDPYDNVYDGAKPNYNSPRLRGYDEPQSRPVRRPSERKRPSSPAPEIRDEPRRSKTRRPETDNFAERPRPRQAEDSYVERDVRPRRRPASAPPSDGYDSWNAQDEWADSSRNASGPIRRPMNPDRPGRMPKSTPPLTNSRPNPTNLADLGRSYDEPEDNYGSDDLERNYDSQINRSNDGQNESIPGDFVVDYQPLNDSEAADYADEYDDYDDYDDSEQDDYDNYDDSEDDNYSEDLRRQPGRKPINFEE